mgnify:CR=1 FL=1
MQVGIQSKCARKGIAGIIDATQTQRTAALIFKGDCPAVIVRIAGHTHQFIIGFAETFLTKQQHRRIISGPGIGSIVPQCGTKGVFRQIQIALPLRD